MRHPFHSRKLIPILFILSGREREREQIKRAKANAYSLIRSPANDSNGIDILFICVFFARVRSAAVIFYQIASLVSLLWARLFKLRQ